MKSRMPSTAAPQRLEAHERAVAESLFRSHTRLTRRISAPSSAGVLASSQSERTAFRSSSTPWPRHARVSAVVAASYVCASAPPTRARKTERAAGTAVAGAMLRRGAEARPGTPLGHYVLGSEVRRRDGMSWPRCILDPGEAELRRRAGCSRRWLWMLYSSAFLPRTSPPTCLMRLRCTRTVRRARSAAQGVQSGHVLQG